MLLYGPPGTGKTLLARAVAGEAGVPFFSISGSDFVEMFVGVGASRVRDLFEQAKQNSPCIIFMDEIDAVGRHRGAGMGGGHDEREQTLNQLLVEMDGFEMKDNIILIAATNRPDILDPALLRPGRFDRQIVVDRPDRKGRKQILEVHTRGKPLAQNIDLDALAGQTPGFTGADLANLINEAALLTARSSKREITMTELEEGIMRVIAGPEKKSRVMSEKERLVTAYHELGHAIVGHLLPNSDPVHKVSIISRGQALGYTISLPTEDKFLTTRAELNDTMAMTLGGRAAEEIVFERDHHRRLQRPREGDRDREADGDALRHVRAPRPARLRPRPLACPSSAASSPPSPTTRTRSRARSTTRSAGWSRTRTRPRRTSSPSTASSSTRSRKILLERETIEAEEFIALLEGKPEEEVFSDEQEEAKPPEAPARRGEGHRPTRAPARARAPVPAWPAAERRDARERLVALGNRNTGNEGARLGGLGNPKTGNQGGHPRVSARPGLSRVLDGLGAYSPQKRPQARLRAILRAMRSRTGPALLDCCFSSSRWSSAAEAAGRTSARAIARRPSTRHRSPSASRRRPGRT